MLARGLISAFSVLALIGIAACDTKDPKKCEEALGVVRQALTLENFDSAGQWRNYAYKHCADPGALSSLDSEIVSKQAAVAAKAQEEERRARETKELTKVFLQWVSTNRNQPDKAAASPLCEGEAAPAGKPPAQPQAPRFCSATRNAGSFVLAVRYDDNDKTRVKFSTHTPNPVTCADLGATSLVKSWDVAATGGRTAKRFRCEFPAGPLSGLQTVVSAAANAEVYIFSPNYLGADDVFKQVAGG